MRKRRRRVSQKPFLEKPFLIIWELVKPPKNDWGALDEEYSEEVEQLSLEDKKAVVDQISELGKVKLIFSGGNLLEDEDFIPLLTYASNKGLTVALRPTLTTETSAEKLSLLRNIGVFCLSVNLDGPTESVHDKINGEGSFKITERIIAETIDLNIPLQINTSLSKVNNEFVKELAEKIKLYPVVLWNVVMTLVDEEDLLSASECELLYQWLYDFSKTAPFDIKTTSGQQFHRVIIQNKRRENKITGNYIHYRDALLKGVSGVKCGGIERAPYGINDGKGMLFISSSGYIYPSSMLPIKLGHIKEDKIIKLYRNNKVMKEIHDTDLLKGKCGICEYRNICGGSRARTYLVTGDYLEADPYCFYKPPQLYKLDSIELYDDE